MGKTDFGIRKHGSLWVSIPDVSKTVPPSSYRKTTEIEGIIKGEMVVYVEQGVKTIYQSSMFKCKECDSTEFNLMLQPGFAGKVDITVNDDHEVVIQVNGKEFIADLMFMNQFAVCKCGEIKTWEYFYPNRPNSKVESAPVEE